MNVPETPQAKAQDEREDKPRYGVDPYLDWLGAEGIPVTEDYGVDLFAVDTAPWPRYGGVNGAAVHLKGRGDFANMFLFDIGPGRSTAPQRHLYEEVVYVLEGHGSTQLEFADGGRRSFEWCEKSLFAIPLNAKYRHFNGSGTERALLVSTTNLPMIMNVFHSEDFVFACDCDFDFRERAGKREYFFGEGNLITVRPGNHMWETNFVPDLTAIELKSWGDRGAGGTNIMFVLADGTMHAHISEMPVGTYKKAHRHGPSFHVMCVMGQGFSLLWYGARKRFPPHRLETRHGAGTGRPAISSAFQYRAGAGALSRHCGRLLALSDHASAARFAAWRQRRRHAGGVEKRQGRRRRRTEQDFGLDALRGSDVRIARRSHR